jgi:DNA primase
VAGLIRRSDIDEVRSRTNLADVVGDYVTLKGAGSGSMKGLCPFHEERSPSFHVRPQVGFYHCFGCGEGGDVFTFLQKMDHVTFSEAVERMAAKLGYELHYEDGGQASDHGNRARLLSANQVASEYFVVQLATPEAEPARTFLGSRGFDQSAAERFGVGFAPKSYDALSNHLKALGYTEQELLEAGLVGQGDRGTYDRFRGRLVWPIRDTTGQAVGFGARKLLDDDQGPKYLNTPETAVYHKSQVLYGLDLAKKDIARGRQVVVVEGYTDVMACHLAGITTAVATCGTAFGVDHIKMIRRVMGDVENRDSTGTGEVIFTFDPDEAGQKAAGRAFAEEQRFAAQTFVAVAPDGLDPCDLRLNRGDDAIRRLISTRKPMFEFMIKRTLTAHNLDTVEGRVAALRAAAPVVAGIRDQSMSSGYIRNLAGWLGMDPTEVSRAVTAAKAEVSRATSGRSGSGSGSSSGQGAGEGAYGARGSDKQSQAQTDGRTIPVDAIPTSAPSLMNLPTDPTTRLERDALMAILQRPADVGADFISRAARVAFFDNTLAVVRDGIATSLEHVEAADWLQRVADEVPVIFATLVKQLGVAPIPQREELLATYCRGVVSALIERELLRNKKDLMGALQRLDSAAEPARYAELQRELMATEAERRTLREG